MRAAYAVQGIGFLVLFGVVMYLAAHTDSEPEQDIITPKSETTMPEMILRSPAFGHEQPIPSKYTCDGENLSPPLAIDNIPEGTVTLTLLVEDPDVPTTIREDGTWNHWIVFNIPPTTERIAEGEAPEGIVAMGTNAKAAYTGPCPPDREHRYFFRVYALDTELSLDEHATKEALLAAQEGHILAQAELMGRYARSE